MFGKMSEKCEPNSNDMIAIGTGAVICVVFGLALSIGVVDAVFRAAKVSVAPRVVLAEKTLNMFKDK